MRTIRAKEMSDALSSRYGLKALNCEEWDELELFGGIGMDAATFSALANAAQTHGDTQVTVYELESIKIEFQPVQIHLDFASFNQIKANTISLFDVAMVPASRTWVALLTDELETFVYGPLQFLSDVARNASL
jgi:hypothetical protein